MSANVKAASASIARTEVQRAGLSRLPTLYQHIRKNVDDTASIIHRGFAPTCALLCLLAALKFTVVGIVVGVPTLFARVDEQTAHDVQKAFYDALIVARFNFFIAAALVLLASFGFSYPIKKALRRLVVTLPAVWYFGVAIATGWGGMQAQWDAVNYAFVALGFVLVGWFIIAVFAELEPYSTRPSPVKNGIANSAFASPFDAKMAGVTGQRPPR